MKLIIQIPCYNEEQTLALSIDQLPREIEGIDEVEFLIIDDGSSDNTVEVARGAGVHHIVRHIHNEGLAKAFLTGLEACLERGADIIVNTDADNQYSADSIPDLVQPILNGKADLVIGARPITSIEHFSFLKKKLQLLGSWVVRVASKTDVRDAPSGFRAMTANCAMQLNVFNNYTYTLETIIQAGQKNMAIVSVPVGVNEDLRPSRLVKSIPKYIQRSILTIVRIFIVYKPFRFFAAIGSLLFLTGFLIGLRFLFFYLTEGGAGMIQSLILSAVLLGIGIQTILVAFLADLLAVNRRILEDTQLRLKSMKNSKNS
jgi:glycosyltransferase involved in cell wall biosynthesis